MTLVHAQWRYGFLANPLAAAPGQALAYAGEGYAAFVRAAVLWLAISLGVWSGWVGLNVLRGGVWLGGAALAAGVGLTALALGTLPGCEFLEEHAAIWRLWLSGGASIYVGAFVMTYAIGVLWRWRRGIRAAAWAGGLPRH
jgi:hypothetical protein